MSYNTNVILPAKNYLIFSKASILQLIVFISSQGSQHLTLLTCVIFVINLSAVAFLYLIKVLIVLIELSHDTFT